MLEDNDRANLVSLRIKSAYTTLEESKLLLDNEYWNAAVNRMYYACYYIVSALLINNGIEAATHAGVRKMLGLHFVKQGLLSSNMNAFYSDIFAKRHSGDYDIFILFDGETVSELYSQAIEFVKTIEVLILNKK